jgi:hypothetical protein
MIMDTPDDDQIQLCMSKRTRLTIKIVIINEENFPTFYVLSNSISWNKWNTVTNLKEL